MALQLTDSLMIADTVSLRPEDIFASCGDGVLSVGGALRESAMATAEAVYGAASTLVAPDGAVQVVAENPAPLTGNIFYDLAVLACFLSLCLIVYFYRGYAFGIFSVFRGGATTEKILGEQSKVFGAFLISMISLGLLITGLCVLKFADLFLRPYLDGLSGWQAAATVFGAWGGTVLVWGYQWVFLKAAGSLTLSQGFVGRLFYLKKIVAAIGTVAVLPLFLLFALSDGQSAQVLGILTIIIAGLLTIFLIIRTFMLFVRQNFSILLWFLYFCVVEIFPVSLAAVIAAKVLG